MFFLRIIRYGVLTVFSLFLPVYRSTGGLSLRKPKNLNFIRGFYSEVFSEENLEICPSFTALSKLSTKILKPTNVSVEISNTEKSLQILVDNVVVFRVIDSKYKIHLEGVDIDDVEICFVKNIHQFNKFYRIPVQERPSKEPATCATLYLVNLCKRVRVTEADVIYLLRCGITYKNFLDTYSKLKKL